MLVLLDEIDGVRNKMYVSTVSTYVTWLLTKMMQEVLKTFELMKSFYQSYQWVEDESLRCDCFVLVGFEWQVDGKKRGRRRNVINTSFELIVYLCSFFSCCCFFLNFCFDVRAIIYKLCACMACKT